MDEGIREILLIEDSPADARLIQELLREARSLQCRLQTAETLSEAMTCLDARSYSIVLTDLGLPDSSGLDGLMMILSKTPETPTIILTGWDDLELAQRAIQSGAQDYLPKSGLTADLLERSIRYAVDRKRAQQALARSESLYRTLFEQTMAPITMVSPEGQCIDANTAAQQFLECSRDELLGKSLWDFFPMDSREEQILRMREHADSCEGETLEIECCVNGRRKTLLTNMVATVCAAGHETIFGIGQDITPLKEAERQLKASLQGTIHTVSALTERRDPYTSGHQRRVTELACAIAGKLRWPSEQIAGLRAAGLMHDIGKVAVPAEILAIPRTLTETEFAIIQAHSVVGYDVLAPVDFPWPVASAVRQHHERIDGSGYPDRLAGSKILPEARVLAVADTVEAMSSHRPYRPALGVEAALDEVEKMKGRLYDRCVVEACLELIRQGDFSFD